MKFKKNNVIVEAVQLRWDNWGEMCDHVGVGKMIDRKPEGVLLGNNGFPVSGSTGDDKNLGLAIPTKEGVLIGRQNDYIIRGIGDELSVCRPDIFESTYEPVS